MILAMEILAYVAAFACLLFAAHLFAAQPMVRTPARLLGANFLVYAVQALLLAARFGGWLPQGWAPLRPVLAMTLGPLLFLYFESAADPAFRLKPRHALHFLPAVLIAVEFLTLRFPVDIDFAIFASFGGYAAALALRARVGPARFAHLGAREARIAFHLLVGASVVLAGSFATEVAIFLDLAHGAPLSASPALLATLLAEIALVVLAMLAALSRPSPFDWMYAFGRRGERTFLSSGAERAASAAAFDRLVASEKIWLEEGTPLATVAGRLGLPPRQLSEAINSVHGESFSRRLNRLRVEETKRLLREEPGLSMTAAMFDAGFRTKSSFNREFRALTGMSPSEYRERMPNCR